MERYTFDKAHGYSNVKRYLNNIVQVFSTPLTRTQYNSAYHFALALDPEFGILTDPGMLKPDFFTRNPGLFKAKKGKDSDSPGIVEALSGPYREEFLKAMQVEVDELEHHKTWEVIKKSDIPKQKMSDGTERDPQIYTGT